MAAPKAKPYTVIIVQARMGSTRLPGKTMKHVIGRPLLSFAIERLQRTTQCDEILVATTRNPKDQKIIDFCRNEHIYFYVGDEDDVLDRYYQAAKTSGAEAIVRVTGDCPLTDPKVVDHIVSIFHENYPKYDYVSNVIDRTYPRGLDVEVFSMRCLEEMKRYATSPDEREHVTTYVLHHPDRFNTHSVTQADDHSFHRWTVDTEDDLQLVTQIIEELYPTKSNFSTNDVLALLEANPDWLEINAHVEQKKMKRA